MCVLSVGQMANSPSSYLQRRFQGTVIKTANFGVIYVERVRDDRSFVFREFSAVGQLTDRSRTVAFPELGDILVARPPTGAVNTRFGLLVFADLAGHQWSWGACSSRLSFSTIGNTCDSIRHRHHAEIYWYMFQQHEKTYLYQWLQANDGMVQVAVSREIYAQVNVKKRDVRFFDAFTKKPVTDWYENVLGQCCGTSLMQLFKQTTMEGIRNYV